MTVMSNDPQTAALLSHVVSQIEQNVQFLVSQNYLSQADAAPFLNKLARVEASGAPSFPAPAAIPPTPARRAVSSAPATPAPAGPRAKAMWDYNGSADGDLSFKAGDIIEIVKQDNADWWTGRLNGREALFPASYVEKVQDAPAPAARSLPPVYNRSGSSEEKPAYKPFMAAHSNANAPPPPGAGTNTVGLQQDPGQEQKKSKFGKYGNTMAHSAAGGVGFGAGAAIGGGLVRAIF